MNPKNTWLLVVLAAGLFAFIWLVEPRLRPLPPAPRRVMPALKPAEVTGIQIQSKSQVRVERTNGTWVMTKPLVYPVKTAAVENFLSALAELSPRTRITAEELRKIKNVSDEYGFGSPQASITLEFSQEPPRTLLLGSLTPARDGLYAELLGGADSVDVISADFLKLVPRQTGDWRDSTFVNLAGLDFDRISVIHGDKTIELAHDATNKLWRMTRPEGRADNPKLENLLVNLQSLRASTFVNDAPTAADLQQFGLQPPQLALAFSLDTNQLFSLQFGGSPAGDSSLVYARSNAQSTVVLLPRDLLTGWSAAPDDFRERHLLDVALNPPDQIEVSGEENFKVQFTNGGWFVIDATKQVYRADKALMLKFLGDLARLQVADQPGKTEDKYIFKGVASDALLPDYGLGGVGTNRPYRSYILTHSSPPVTTNELDFGIVTNGFRLAKRTDEPPVVTVRTDDFGPLPARALELRERRIWNFDPTNVTRLTVRDTGKSQVWEHKGPNDWEPANKNYITSNPAAVSMGMEQAMTILGELQVLKWVERGDTNRAKYDIDDQHPRIALDVTKGDVSKTLFIDFGDHNGDAGAYASVPVLEDLNWTNWVVVISRDDIQKLLDWLPLAPK